MKSWSRWPWNLRIIPSLNTKSIPQGQYQLRNRRHVKQKSKENNGFIKITGFLFLIMFDLSGQTFSLAVLQTGSENKPRFQVFLHDVSPVSNWSRLLLQPTDFKSSSICVIKKWQSSNTQTLWEANQFPFNRRLGLCTPVSRVYLHFIDNIQ